MTEELKKQLALIIDGLQVWFSQEPMGRDHEIHGTHERGMGECGRIKSDAEFKS